MNNRWSWSGRFCCSQEYQVSLLFICWIEKLEIFIDLWLRPTSICNQIEIWKCGEETQPTTQWLSFPPFLSSNLLHLNMKSLVKNRIMNTQPANIALSMKTSNENKIKSRSGSFWKRKKVRKTVCEWYCMV